MIVLPLLLFLGARTALLQESASTPANGNIEVSGRINLPKESEVVIGEPFAVEVVITAKGPDPQLNAEPPRINWPQGLSLVSGMERQESRVSQQNGKRLVEQAYIYEIVPEAGNNSISIGAFSVNYWIRGDETAKTLVIPGTMVKVLDSRGDAISAQLWFWAGMQFIVFAVVLALFYTFFCRRRKRRETHAEAQGVTGEESPEGLFLRSLTAAQKLLIAGEPKLFYADMEKHVRIFIERKYKVKIKEDSEQNVENLVKEGMSPERAGKLVSLLERCQEVRFSPQEPSPPENNRFQREIEEVVRASNPGSSASA